MAGKPLDAIRYGPHAAAIKDACVSAAVSVRAPDSATSNEYRILDSIVLDGDHDIFQRSGDKQSSVDCIIFVIWQDGEHQRLVQVLVELKAGSFDVSNVHQKFKNSWRHARGVLQAAGLQGQSQSALWVLGSKIHKDDARRLRVSLQECKGNFVQFLSGDRQLVELLPVAGIYRAE